MLTLMTAEMLAEMEALRTEHGELMRTIRDYQAEQADRDAARARATVIEQRLEVINTIRSFQAKIDEAAPFLEIYGIVKPQASAALAKVLDEAGTVILDALEQTTVGPRWRQTVATMQFDTYQAFIAAGFTEDQAFTLLLNVNAAVASSASKINIKKS